MDLERAEQQMAVEEAMGGGYDLDIFAENPDDDLLCSICRGVLRCPVMVSCSHIFCRKCILQWLKRQQTCPCCRTEVKGKLFVQMHKLKKRINRLQVKCPNEANGCPATFPLSRTEEHAESCAFRLLCCSNEGCPAEVLRKDICEHSQSCQYWRDMCHMGCGTLLTPENRDEHNCYMELKEQYNKQLHKLRQKARRIESLTSQMSRQIQLLSEGLEGVQTTAASQETQ
ncbi:PREDICTED: RING finger protein 151 [Nanorana parkeri]|uniref:RING finger protein 151 n=1 Tax=Nanorana parkeri TaxID=125878 RepID=UPI000854662A|nr:PREDICTED: RING finger protein 151 [Nanorana parkeri]